MDSFLSSLLIHVGCSFANELRIEDGFHSSKAVGVGGQDHF